jgi:hypothetical protein
MMRGRPLSCRAIPAFFLGTLGIVMVWTQGLPAQPCPESVGELLLGSIFEGSEEIIDLDVENVPENLRPALVGCIKRFRSFVSRLPKDSSELEEVDAFAAAAMLEKRRRMERAIVSLLDCPDAAAAAAEYAARATLCLEWEGMSDGPLREADFAERYLEQHPRTPLRPYLLLFLGHRLLRAAEALVGEGSEVQAQKTLAMGLSRLEEAAAMDLPLVRLVAHALKDRYVVTDPRAWALSRFAVSHGPQAGQPGTLREIPVDLDGDGAAELLIGSVVAKGNACGEYFAFRRMLSGYLPIGSLFLHPDAFQVQTGSGPGAKPRIMRYWRLGPDEGWLDSLVHDGREFVLLSREKVRPYGPDRARLQQLFGARFAVEAEGQEGLQ